MPLIEVTVRVLVDADEEWAAERRVRDVLEGERVGMVEHVSSWRPDPDENEVPR